MCVCLGLHWVSLHKWGPSSLLQSRWVNTSPSCATWQPSFQNDPLRSPSPCHLLNGKASRDLHYSSYEINHLTTIRNRRGWLSIKHFIDEK